MANLRVTAELHNLLRRTAAYTGLDVSDVIRKTALGISRGRAVVHFAVDAMYHEKPTEVLKVRGLELPEGIDPDEFRRLLAMRCMEELSRPKPVPLTFREREGIDYVVIGE